MKQQEANEQQERQESSEFQTYSERVSESEFMPQKERVEADEFGGTYEPESEQGKENEKKDTQEPSQTSSGLMTTIATVATAVVLVVNTVFNTNMNVDIQKITQEDNYILYEAKINEKDEDSTLFAYLYEGDRLLGTQDFSACEGDEEIRSKFVLDDDEMTRLSESEEPINYRLEMRGDIGLGFEQKLGQGVVRVQKKEMISEFRSIAGECHCEEDGCYHFWLDFTDDYGEFINFSAVITDSAGNTSACNFSNDLHGMQKINVKNLDGVTAQLTVSYIQKSDNQRRTITQNISI